MVIYETKHVFTTNAQQLRHSVILATVRHTSRAKIKQESPAPFGGAVRNATTLIPKRLSCIILAITCYQAVSEIFQIDHFVGKSATAERWVA